MHINQIQGMNVISFCHYSNTEIFSILVKEEAFKKRKLMQNLNSLKNKHKNYFQTILKIRDLAAIATDYSLPFRVIENI